MSEHRHALANLVERHGWTRGAELGVDKGILTGMLLRQCPDLKLIAVDLFPNLERSKRVFGYESEHFDRLTVMKMSTADAARLVDDASLDFVFIDADHSYDAVMEDITLWAPKVRPGGWLGGHDFHQRKFPGVVEAVQRYFRGTDVHFMPGTIWGTWAC